MLEAGKALPPSPTASGVTREATDPALESEPSEAGVTPPEGAVLASQGDSRVRGEAEPGDDGSVAAENFLTAGDRNATVPGCLPPPRDSPAPPNRRRVTAEGTDPAHESDSLAAGVTPPEGAAPEAEGDRGAKGQAEPGDAAFVVKEKRRK